MKVGTRLIAAGAAATACCVIGFASFAGDKGQAKGHDKNAGHSHAAQTQADPMAEMMARCEAYAAINENHQFLAKWEGDWNLKIKHWMSPEMPPMENDSSASSKMVMDGHYLIEKVKGAFDMGDGNMTPFEGMAIMGYDNNKQMYFSTWIDNMGSGMMEEWGERKGNTIEMKGESYNPMFGAVVPSKSVATIVDANTRKLEMFTTPPGGKSFKMMEIVYTRK